MAEIFWTHWNDEPAVGPLKKLFDAILLKEESPFPDCIILPDFKPGEKILLFVRIPYLVTPEQNDSILFLVSTLIDLIPSHSTVTLFCEVSDPELEKVWIEKFPKLHSLARCTFIKLPKPIQPISPFLTTPPKKDLLNQWFLPEDFVQADQIIPIIPFEPSPVFGIFGLLSSFFWLTPTLVRNEILIQKNRDLRSAALMEIVSVVLPKITISGLIFQDTAHFCVFGNDPAAVDAFSSALIGIKASSIATTKYCTIHKIAMGDLLKIHVQGERFRKPLINHSKRFKPVFSLFIDPSRCNLCMECIDRCPLQCIFEDNSILYYKKQLCNFCGYCVELCPKKAISEV